MPEFLSLPGDLASRFGCDRASEALVGDWYDARVGVAGCDIVDWGPESLCLFFEGGSAIGAAVGLRCDDCLLLLKSEPVGKQSRSNASLTRLPSP